MMNSPMIHAHDVHKHFGSLEVLKGVSLDIGKGEVLAVIGPSGSGKSTFLRCLNHLETINRGRIDIEGETLVSTDAHGVCHYVPEPDIRRICGKMGMVFQHFNLFPHMTVLENVIEAPITVKGMRREEIVPKAEALLAKVGLLEKRASYPSRLSGGQKQRVAIARAFVARPRILFADEPTGSLDQATGHQVGDLLFALNAHAGTTLVLVTHDLALARRCGHVYRLDGGRLLRTREGTVAA